MTIFIRKILGFYLLFFYLENAMGQYILSDSLTLKLKNFTHDSLRCAFLEGIIEEENDPSVWMLYNSELIRIASAANKKYPETHPLHKLFTRFWASGIGNQAYYYQMTGDSKKAITCYEQIYLIYTKSNSKSLMALTLNNLGVVYNNSGEVEKAIACYNSALKINEALLQSDSGIKTKKRYSQTLTNLGTIYSQQGDLKKAEEFLVNAAKIQHEIENKSGEAVSLTNLASLYDTEKDANKINKLIGEVLKIRKEIGDTEGMSDSYITIGAVLFDNGNYDSSLYYFEKALKLRKKLNYKTGISSCLDYICNAHKKLGHLKQAISYGESAFQLARESKSPRHIRESALSLYYLYNQTKNFKKSLENYEIYIQMSDSINNESTRKASIKSQLKYEYEKQAAADSVAHAKENEVKNAELAKQSAEIKAKKNQQYALFGGLALVMIFAGFMYNRFKVTQKQKEVIERQKLEVESQKHLVEEKQREILDSIYYAKRIQLAQIPSDKRVLWMITKVIGKNSN
ncbi:MAG: tetratricopeptide repeat protein [Sphingobacteriaceae bacterium]|nr:tetratricopeptide repeat protein [Sphingobacteriaceae bacterium]